ncbi:MAG: hypothetical protein ABIK44_07440 [candidate division WOR-3 bacterium]
MDWIEKMRGDHPRIGKEKLKSLLDRYCAARGLKAVSESTISNTLKRHNYFHQPQGRVYHDPESKWAAKRNAEGGRRNIEKDLMSQISLT